MLMDIATIIRKEWKEMLLLRGSLRGGLANILIIIAVFGVVIPLQSGAEWFNVPLLQIVCAWCRYSCPTWLVADALPVNASATPSKPVSQPPQRQGYPLGKGRRGCALWVWISNW